MKNTILTFFFAFVTIVIQAQNSSNTITTAAPFLLISTDARAGGMADIGAATSADAFSVFHNPAKTAFSENQINIGLNYTPWLRNLTNDIFIGGASYINRFKENQAWAVDFKYFSLGEVELTDALGGSEGTENPSEFALTGVYSLKLSETFSMGIGLKYIYSNLDISDNLNAANSFAVDISGYYQSPKESYGDFDGRYRIGFNIANIGPKISYTPGVENFIPTNLKLGGGFDFILDNFNTLGVNLEFTKLLVPSDPNSTDGWFEGIFTSFGDSSFSQELKEITWALGAEYKYNKAFSIRTGYFNESKDYGNRQFFTLGAGFEARAFSLDLSYLINASDINNPLENTLRFSLAFDLGQIYDDF
ncbi:type IX secretion system outer membrane channel protein PorV [Tenacibaculum sp. UWU-22]|uniref:type IX secretion system outer membrane channel protein PorV n=1 Tax=Tenacibaculum sp. UWU-22 TaxID=3234187 RepID=UPI0034DB0767